MLLGSTRRAWVTMMAAPMNRDARTALAFIIAGFLLVLWPDSWNWIQLFVASLTALLVMTWFDCVINPSDR